MSQVFSTVNVNGGESAANTETIVCTSPIIEVPKDGAVAIITTNGRLQTGAGATGYFLQIRRGATLASLSVFNAGLVTLGANSPFYPVLNFMDLLVGQATVQYSLTYTGNAETGTAIFANSFIGVYFGL